MESSDLTFCLPDDAAKDALTIAKSLTSKNQSLLMHLLHIESIQIGFMVYQSLTLDKNI